MVSDAPVIEHEYTLGQIIGWWWRGQYQHILWRIPGVNPRRDPTYPPSWWYRWWTLYEWVSNHHSETWRPYLWCIQRWQEGARLLLGAWIDEVGNWAKAFAVWKMYDVVGRPKHGEPLVYTFLRTLEQRTGTTLPTWAVNVIGGLQVLFNWFPLGIVNETTTWAGLFRKPFSDAVAWVNRQYSAIKNWYEVNVTAEGSWWNKLTDWYDDTFGWINDFIDDPVGTILGWLVLTWATWNAFWTDPVAFICGLWNLDSQKVHDFFDDPLMWVYDRVEDELIRRW